MPQKETRCAAGSPGAKRRIRGCFLPGISEVRTEKTGVSGEKFLYIGRKMCYHADRRRVSYRNCIGKLEEICAFLPSQPTPREGTIAVSMHSRSAANKSQPTPREGPNEQKTHTCTVCVFAVKESLFSKNQRPTFCRWAFQFVEKVHPLPRGEGGPEGVGRGMRAEIQKSAPFKDLQKSWLMDENSHKYLVFLRPKFPPDFLFSLASLDSFPPGEAIGCCRTRGFFDSLKGPPLAGGPLCVGDGVISVLRRP